ncbi:MAG: EamA family transporter [Pseudomonadota bacterium]
MVKATYLSVIVIWSTTPLAIKWSIEPGVLFGLMSRLSIGLLVLIVFFAITGQKLKFNRVTSLAYLTAGIGIYFAMLFVYWSAQYIPSGWMSVIFGLSPIITGLLSVMILGENHFTLNKTMGMLLSLSGLIVIFYTSAAIDVNAVIGVFAMLMSTIAHSVSAVLLKKINAPISGTQSTFGGLLIAAPLVVITYLLFGKAVGEFSPRSVASLLYLGAIATAAGFSMYYYILNRLDAVKVSLIALVTPVCALFLGILLNHEPLSISVLIGGALVISGLALFELQGKKPESMKSINDEAEQS